MQEPMDVLVIDDNPVARELLGGMVQSWGWTVDTAAGGAEALSLMQARTASGAAPYQTLLVDWQMPGMDGWETIERMHQMAPDTKPPITVMVTAHGRESLSQRSAREQARLNAFLVKPITSSMLYDAVADARAGLSNLRARPRNRTQQSGRLDGLRLLVVEDNLINQQVAQELLSAEGAHVQIAGNGQLGVAAVAAANPPFDAVLMDLQMPVMDGYEATQMIRQTLGLTQLAVIAMTANAMASDRDACLAAGMNDHVGKPFDLPHLIEVLRSHTGRGRSAVPEAVPPSAPLPLAPDTLPATDAVDPDNALKRLGGNANLYADILRAYLRDTAALPDQFDALIAAGDSAAAVRLLHTLKGLSATVGATYLAALARSMELTAKSGSAAAQWQQLGPVLRQAVTATLASMGQIAARYAPDEGTTSAGAEPPDMERLRAELQELQELLKTSDLRALEVHARLPATSVPGLPQWEIGMGALAEALQGFDFAAGVMACESLIAQLDAG
jgi:CheY-like chemotaxis protein/HPt (histidine-containing phosphotransfer) domain-containing protein